MSAARVILKVALQDTAIVVAWLLVAPVTAQVMDAFPQWLGWAIFILVVGLYSLVLFFSNAELFKWLKNDYVWSVSTGVVTLFVFVIPSVMWVAHNNIYEVFAGAYT